MHTLNKLHTHVAVLGLLCLPVWAQDVNPPAFIAVTGNTNGTTGGEITLSATVEDNVNIASVVFILGGQMQGAALRGSRSRMTLASVQTTYSTTVHLPTHSVADVPYFIEAADAAGNTARSPATGNYTITVTDNILPTVTVLQPNGGERWNVERPSEIRWRALDNIGVTSVNLHYSTNGGANWTALATDRPNDGVFQWILPKAPSTNYLVKIAVADAANNRAEDVADRAFSVLPPSLPFSDDTENTATANWFFGSGWGYTTQYAHSGTNCISDSPETTYPNSANRSLTSNPFDFSRAFKPVLVFWQRYAFEPNADFGYVEISTNGGTNWEQLAYYTGPLTTWQEEKIDLTEWTAKPDVRIRFRVQSDAQNAFDGWYLDDVSIQETVASIPYPFFDDMEDPAQTQRNWASGAWALVSDAHSGTNAWTDSPAGPYPAGGRARLTLANTIDLTAAVRPQLTFWHRLNLDTANGCCWYEFRDYAYVQLSTDSGNGGTYTTLRSFNENPNTWRQEVIDLSAYAGLANVRIKFYLPEGNSYDASRSIGWSIDDVALRERPNDVTLQEPANVTMHGADLSWTSSTEAQFGRYELYRDTTNAVSRSSVLVATVTNVATTIFRDVYTALEPVRYFYRLYVLDTSGMASAGSPAVRANYALPVADYPFFDNLEASPTNWNWGAPWTLTTEYAFRGTNAWTDSAGGLYGNNVNSALSLGLNLRSAVSPQLSFQHRYSLEGNADFAYVEVSGDLGATWKTVYSVSGQETNWHQARIDLSVWAGNTNVHVRFRLQSNASGVADGWYIDDVACNESTAHVVLPFTDDLEAGLANWMWEEPWGLTTNLAHSGQSCLTDSPDGTYQNNANRSLMLSRLDLQAAVKPVLVFWQRYAFEPNADFGYVEVSINGGASWDQAAYYTGPLTTWQEEKIDLTEWTAKPDVRIRFRVQSDAQNAFDGWYLDDVSIQETVASIPYPFFDDMEDPAQTQRNWASGAWALVSDAHSGTNAWTDSPAGPYPAGGRARLTLANTIDLTAAVRPQLTFWHRLNLDTANGCCWYEFRDYAYVQLSTDSGNGGTYTTLRSFNENPNTWRQEVIDLSAYAGLANVRIKFYLPEGNSYDASRSIGWSIDDVALRERPNDVTLQEPANVTMHGADLSWTSSTEAQFGRYELYRDTTNAVSRSSVLVATVTNVATTIFRDVYTALEPVRYFYRLYVLDTSGMASAGSPAVRANYALPVADYPFFDNLEASPTNWNWGAPWTLTTEYAFRGTNAWTDSAGGLYGNNVNSALSLGLNLRSAVSPQLSFQHRYSLEGNADFAYVEVSGDLGATWKTVYSVSGQETNWHQARIDLSVWAGNTNVHVRFRLQSNASGVADGWYIDDVACNESTAHVVLPFTDDLEAGLANWMWEEPWGLTTNLAHSGQSCLTDSPDGTYQNNANRSLMLSRLDLQAAVKPVLVFWQRYAFEPNADFGYVEVSINGGASWDQAAYYTGPLTTWQEEKIDLTEWTAKPDVRIRFRVQSDAQNAFDGWYLDDVSIQETADAIPYPFFDDMEDPAQTQRNWASGAWALVSDAHSGTNAWTDSPAGPYPAGGRARLTLANTIDLTAAVRPQLTFWHRLNLDTANGCCWYEFRDYAYVQLSTDSGNGGTYTTLRSFNENPNTWRQEVIDLSAYAGLANVRIKFYLPEGNSYDASRSIGWSIDDVYVGETPTNSPMANVVRLESPRSIFATQGVETETVYGLVYEPGVTDAAGAGTGLSVQLGFGARGTYPDDRWTWVDARYDSDLVQTNKTYDKYGATLTVGVPGMYDYTYRFKLSPGRYWTYADLDGNDLGALGWNGYLPAQAGRLEVNPLGAKVATPVFSPESGMPPPVTVSLGCATAEARIYFTTDGSEPTPNSPVYVAPLNLTQPTTLKARAFRNGLLDSDLAVATYLFHSADYRLPFWSIDGSEVNRVLSYWRAEAHHLDASGFDGYSPDLGNTNGPKHSSDFREPFWLIDGTEANRVLAYWRAGGYHRDANGVDGFAPGRPAALANHGIKTGKLPGSFAPRHELAATYKPGGTVAVTINMTYHERPLALLWRPELPPGWRIVSVVGDGNPELESGELLWTTTIPSSPVQVVCDVSVPPGESGLKRIRSAVEVFVASAANPMVVEVSPGPLFLDVEGSGLSQFTEIRRLTDGKVKLIFRGELGKSYEILVSHDLVHWSRLATVLNESGVLEITDSWTATLSSRFYRARLLE